MNLKTLLYELSHGEWLMSLGHLNQLRDSVLQGVTTKHGMLQSAQEYKRPEAIECISFYDENYGRVNARSTNDIPEGSIAVIHVVGGMMKYSNWWVMGADEIIAQLDFANSLRNVAAIVLYVDGPGGAVAAIPPFIEFANRKRKPVVSVCDNALSLHFWMVHAISDHVMADNTISARFGSNGVMSSWMDFKKYWEDLGITEHSVYAEQSIHKNEIWRLMDTDIDAGKKMLKEMYLTPTASKFQAGVLSAMPGIKKDVEGVMTGRTFSAEEALANGMIHSIGSMQKAMETAQMLAEVSE